MTEQWTDSDDRQLRSWLAKPHYPEPEWRTELDDDPGESVDNLSAKLARVIWQRDDARIEQKKAEGDRDAYAAQNLRLWIAFVSVCCAGTVGWVLWAIQRWVR